MPVCRTCSIPCGDGTDPLLADAVLLFRALSIDPSTFVAGDPWPNEGTAGADYDAIGGTGGNEPPDPGAPELVVDGGGPGFSICPAGDDVDYYYVPNGPAIEAGTGSFTAFARIETTEESGAFSNVMAKISGQIGVDEHGWLIATGSALGGTGAIVANGGTSPGTDPALAGDGSGTGLDLGEHLLVIRLDRETDDLSIFVDGVLAGTGSASAVTTVEVDHQLIFGRGKKQTGRAYGYWDRALSDDEAIRLSFLVP